jgi:hypothetical protein
VFLALGGAALALVPGTPSFTVPPELALALFVAPVLLDAAYDASPRDLRDNWAPVIVTTPDDPLTATFTSGPFRRRARLFSPCVPATRSATLRFIRWKRN